MYAYFTIVVINPEDWEARLESQESLPATLTSNPQGMQSPSFTGGANATLREFYFRSEQGYPQDGAASITISVHKYDAQGTDHLESLVYVGSVLGGEAFRFDPGKYPLRLNVY